MSYTALYRKFRPSEFGDVKGQEHIVTTLQNQIKANRIGHAYLFCGTRGTGKTTAAKIFARAVNCEHPVHGNPCGECSICKAVASGSSLNVIEIDAASNNGVDNIREIREEVTYPPTEGKFKVYIIDEVHMLSMGAFNALLKTLEEPPSYVVFILATTEAHKIPVTILSRCQRYDFRRISTETIAERLTELLEREHAQAEEKAVRYIAKSADGAMRDALSLLDQCMAFYMGEKLTYDQVLSVIGAVDTEQFSSLLRAVVSDDIPAAMRKVEDLVSQGKDLGQFLQDFIWYLRNLLLLQSSDDMEDVLDLSSENLLLLKEECSMIDGMQIMRYIRIFSELSNQIRFSAQKRILIEIVIIKLCRPEMEEHYDSVLARLDRLEKKFEEGVLVRQQPAQPVVPETPVTETTKPEIPKAIPEDIRSVVQNWRKIVADMPSMVRNIVRKAHLSLGGDNLLLIVLDDVFESELVAKEDFVFKDQIADSITRSIGKKVEIQIQANETGQPFADAFVDLEQVIHTDIEYTEDFSDV